MVFVVSTWLGHGTWYVIEPSWCSRDCVFWIKLTLNLVVSDQSTMPFIVGVGLIHSVEGLNGTTRLSLQRKDSVGLRTGTTALLFLGA